MGHHGDAGACVAGRSLGNCWKKHSWEHLGRADKSLVTIGNSVRSGAGNYLARSGEERKGRWGRTG